ncbi:hypothetical protein DFJ73DRAFT_760389 [Zopfochytrium polystomum]|nr:hypothetical protein DFJ73DRAFT_760389 [Zopfochytrium polystomum]
MSGGNPIANVHDFDLQHSSQAAAAAAPSHPNASAFSSPSFLAILVDAALHTTHRRPPSSTRQPNFHPTAADPTCPRTTTPRRTATRLPASPPPPPRHPLRPRPPPLPMRGMLRARPRRRLRLHPPPPPRNVPGLPPRRRRRCVRTSREAAAAVADQRSEDVCRAAAAPAPASCQGEEGDRPGVWDRKYVDAGADGVRGVGASRQAAAVWWEEGWGRELGWASGGGRLGCGSASSGCAEGEGESGEMTYKVD